MKLKTGNPRVRGPRRNAPQKQRPARRAEPATFAWIEPLADVNPVVVERETITEQTVERPVYVDRPIEVEKLVEVEKVVEVHRPVEVEKIVEREIFIERPVEVEKIIEVEKIVEKPIIVEKEVFVEKEVVVEKEVFVDRPETGDKKKAEVAAAAVGTAALIEADKLSKKDKKALKAEAKADAAKNAKAPKAIIVGRGPSMASKVGRIMPDMPKPKLMPVLVSAFSLLAVIVALSLMSPTGDNASADRGKTVARTGSTSSSSTPKLTLGEEPAKQRGSSRDPFAAKGYTPPPTASTGAAKTKAEQAKAAKEAAATRAGAPAATPSPLYTAKLTTYSSYTPWKNARKRAGGWIDFDNKPTVKVLSVGKSSVVLFVVTDVEVIKAKSAHIAYNKPIRQVKLAAGGVVRFADYRDIQGDDVTYTVRYDGSDKIKLAAATK